MPISIPAFLPYLLLLASLAQTVIIVPNCTVSTLDWVGYFTRSFCSINSNAVYRIFTGFFFFIQSFNSLQQSPCFVAASLEAVCFGCQYIYFWSIVYNLIGYLQHSPSLRCHLAKHIPDQMRPSLTGIYVIATRFYTASLVHALRVSKEGGLRALSGYVLACIPSNRRKCFSSYSTWLANCTTSTTGVQVL